MTATPLLIGPAYSVYVRIARLALMEKGVAYALEEFDVFDPAAVPADYRDRHPFGRVPVLRHGDFELYETAAITRYIDEAFDGPPLQPAEPRRRARQNQVIALLDNYAYWPMVRVVYVQRRDRAEADETAIAAALVESERCLGALQRLLAADYFSDTTVGLADLHAVPMFDYFLKTPDGQDLMKQHGALASWWDRVEERPSVIATRPVPTPG